MGAFAVALVCMERTGIEMHEICRVVAVNVRVFNKVGLSAQNLEVPQSVLHYSDIVAPEHLCKLGPIGWTVESLSGVLNFHPRPDRSWRCRGRDR